MSLPTRLTAFFLLALFLVLAGYSLAVYGLARTYLFTQLEERLELALDTLEASVDIERGGLEWEPADRRMLLGVDPAATSVRWAVRTDDGLLVDQSPNAGHGDFPTAWKPETWSVDPTDGTSLGTRPGWRLAARRLVLDDLLKLGRGHPDDAPGYEKRYPVLILVVGLIPSPVEAALARLAISLALLSSLIWALAAVAGRSLCTRALAPVRRMALEATSMTAAELERRLPLPTTGDELEELGRAFNALLERRQEAYARLHDAFDQQRRFAGDASHELRTPLTALLGQAQIALRRERTVEEYRRALSRIHDEGSRLKSIVESLLRLAQPEGTGPALEPMDLRPWVRDQLLRWSTHPRAADLRYESAEGEPLMVLANPLLLAQVLGNLIENACKYSEPGTEVVVQVRRESPDVILSVSDRGRGLPPDETSRVFEPFFRGASARRDGVVGVGLGLAIARRIALSFGGTLGAESTLGSGSRFWLRLPESTEKVADPTASLVESSLSTR